MIHEKAKLSSIVAFNKSFTWKQLEITLSNTCGEKIDRVVYCVIFRIL